MAEQSAPPLCRVGPPAVHASSRAGAPPWAVRAAAPPRRAASSHARAPAAASPRPRPSPRRRTALGSPRRRTATSCRSSRRPHPSLMPTSHSTPPTTPHRYVVPPPPPPKPTPAPKPFPAQPRPPHRLVVPPLPSPAPFPSRSLDLRSPCRPPRRAAFPTLAPFLRRGLALPSLCHRTDSQHPRGSSPCLGFLVA